MLDDQPLTAEIEYTCNWRFIWSCAKLRLFNPRRAKGLKLKITDHNLQSLEYDDYWLEKFKEARKLPAEALIPFVKYDWERHQYDFGVKQHQGTVIVQSSVSYGLHPGFHSPDERALAEHFDAIASYLLSIAKHRPKEIQ